MIKLNLRKFAYTLIFANLLALISVINVYAADWYNTSWKYRKQITINKSMVSTSDQTNFPLLVYLASDSNLASNAQADGDDIVITSSDGTTKLSHEIEKYTSSTGELWLWVKIPTLSASSNTTLYMYYGNSAVSSQQDATNVWDSNYVGVWHLKETGTGTAADYKDSTSNDNDSTNTTNQPTVTTSGKIGNAESFNGSSTYVDIADSLSLRPSNLTVSAWVKYNDADNMIFVQKWDSGSPNKGYSIEIFSDKLLIIVGGASVYPTYSAATAGTGIWHSVVGTWDGTTQYLYVDGVLRDSDLPGGSVDTASTTVLTMGSRTNHSSSFMDGTLGEVRISNTARSASWIATEYNNQNSPATYETFGSQTYNGEPGRVTDAVTEKALGDVKVTLYTASGSIYTGRAQSNPAQTDANGYYYLEAETGKYYLTATKEGYEDYKSGLFTVSSPVNQPITMTPLDQSKGNYFSIINTVDKKVATIGDVLTYKITVKNLSTTTASSVSVSASLPHDVRLVKGTVRIDGVNQNDPTNLKGPSFSLDPISSNTIKTITYRAIVGPDVKLGKNKNYATVTGTISSTSYSQGPAIATVDIREGVFSKLGMLIGKVYYDENGNGVQDHGERGIPNAAVILDDGTTVVTDEYGRYSVPEISSGLHAVRLDQRVLPGGPLYPKKKIGTVPFGDSPYFSPEPLIERRSLNEWVKSRLGSEEYRTSLRATDLSRAKSRGGSEAIPKDEIASGKMGQSQSARDSHDGTVPIFPYRTDIPQVTRFVNIPESTTGKLDFPIQLLTPKEEDLLKKQHRKETQFMIIGTADGRLGTMDIKGNIQNFKDGNPTEAVDGDLSQNVYQDGRIILYLKGLIKGKYLLTTRYDSTKETQDHLYKYINPERYYPVYGDDSVLTNDADSQGRLFVRIERESSYAEIGNFSTEEFEATQVACYNRVLSGVKTHVRSEDFEAISNEGIASGKIGTVPIFPTKLHITTFLANTTQEEKEDTFSGLGISGPFYLSRTPILEYTERIRIETRDKNKSDTILNTKYLVRDADYNIEYDNGRIFFKAPIPSKDENNDPVFIVIRYEYSANTDLDYNIIGNRVETHLLPHKGKMGQSQSARDSDDGTVPIFPRNDVYQLMLAGQTINEQKDLYNWGMYSVDGILHLTPNIRFLTEYAYSTKSSAEDGQAMRVEATGRFFKDKFIFQGYASQIDEDFFNPVNVTESGTQKYGAFAYVYLTDDMSIIADNWMSRSMEAHTYDRKTSADWIWNYKNFFIQAGYRLKEFIDQDNVLRDTQTHGVETSQGIAMCDNIILSNTITYEREYKHDRPSQKRIDYQKDTLIASPRMDIKVSPDTDLYLRHDIEGRWNYDSGPIFGSNTSKVGLSRISPEGIRSYVEYGFTGQGITTTTIGQEVTTPLTDRMSLKSYINTNIEPYHTTENTGYNSKIRFLDNLYGNLSFERNKIIDLESNTSSNYNAQSASLEYIKDSNTIGTKFEHRDENATSRYNLFANASLNLAENARLLGKGEYSWKRDKDTKETQEDYKKGLLGIAYRPITFNSLNFFGKYEYEENLYQDNAIPLDTVSHTGSVEGVYEPFKYLNISGKYAVKRYAETSDNLTTPSLTDMFTVRPSFRFNDYVDVTGIYRYLRNYDINTQKEFASLEAGLTLFDSLRIAAGYNFTRYDDKNLPDEDYKGYGPYVQMTYKFLDNAEKLLESREEMLKRFADESAIELYRISQIPGDEKFVEEVRACYAQAMKWYKLGNYEEALESLHRGIEAYYAARKYADNAHANREKFIFYLREGENFYKYGLKDKAFTAFEKAYAINAYDERLLRLMTKVRDEIGEERLRRRQILAEKLAGIDRIAGIEDERDLVLETVKLHLKIGEKFYSMGDYKSAVGEWREGIALAKRASEDYLKMKEERKILVSELDSIYDMALLRWERADYMGSKNELERGLNLISEILR